MAARVLALVATPDTLQVNEAQLEENLEKVEPEVLKIDQDDPIKNLEGPLLDDSTREEEGEGVEELEVEMEEELYSAEDIEVEAYLLPSTVCHRVSPSLPELEPVVGEMVSLASHLLLPSPEDLPLTTSTVAHQLPLPPDTESQGVEDWAEEMEYHSSMVCHSPVATKEVEGTSLASHWAVAADLAEEEAGVSSSQVAHQATRSTKACKFWRRGRSCKKGQDCDFSHAGVQKSSAAASEGPCRNGDGCRWLAQGKCKFTHGSTAGSSRRRGRRGRDKVPTVAECLTPLAAHMPPVLLEALTPSPAQSELTLIQEELELSTTNPSKRKEGTDFDHYETDLENNNYGPRKASVESVSVKSVPGITSPVGTNNLQDSYDSFIDESKHTYNERVADEYKTTIKRIQELQALVEEEIGEFEKSRKEVKKLPQITTVLSNVKGVSFPLEITINQEEPAEESIFEIEDIQENEEEASDDINHNAISATCILREKSPVVISLKHDHLDCDSGFEGSPDIKSKTVEVKSSRRSLEVEDRSSPFPRPSTLKRNSDEKKTRDRELLESFLKNENHQIKDKIVVTSNPAERMTPEKKQIPETPENCGVPPSRAQTSPPQKTKKVKKPKITTAAFKESIMKKTYKVRFHVNLKEGSETNAEKSQTVLQSFLSFFRSQAFFGKK